MTSTCERCERLQLQIDEARAVLRKADVFGFGTLAEGVQKALDTRAPKLKGEHAIALSRDDLARCLSRMARRKKKLAEDDETRYEMCIRHEALLIAVSALSDLNDFDYEPMLDQILDGLRNGLVRLIDEMGLIDELGLRKKDTDK